MIILRATIRRVNSLALRLPDDEPSITADEATSISARLLPVLIGATGRSGWDPRVSSIATTATLTPDLGASDLFAVTAQGGPLTIANPAGTYGDGRKMMLVLRDDGTQRALSFGALYFGLVVNLPALTSAGKTMYLGFINNAATARLELVAFAIEA